MTRGVRVSLAEDTTPDERLSFRVSEMVESSDDESNPEYVSSWAEDADWEHGNVLYSRGGEFPAIHEPGFENKIFKVSFR